MTELNIDKQDQVYGAVVRHVLPDWSLGLFAAVLMGSILSSFNSALNSASTLFSLQFYQGYINRNASGEQIVKIGKYFSIGLAIASICIAPLLAQMQSIFEYLQKVNGLYSVPIIGIFLLGILTKRIPAIAAKVGMITGMCAYAFFTFINIQDVPQLLANSDGNLHWLHGYFISFASSIIVMLLIGYFNPKSTRRNFQERRKRSFSDRYDTLEISQESICWNYYYDDDYLSSFDRDCQLILI
jgi:SSS family solute:Na+ symporter